RYFDLLTNGSVSREEFVQVLMANSSAVADDTMGALDNSFINFGCDLMNRFFGPEGAAPAQIGQLESKDTDRTNEPHADSDTDTSTDVATPSDSDSRIQSHRNTETLADADVDSIDNQTHDTPHSNSTGTPDNTPATLPHTDDTQAHPDTQTRTHDDRIDPSYRDEGVWEGDDVTVSDMPQDQPVRSRALNFPEFAEFFSAFQTEYALQLFELYDKNKAGRITVEGFLEIVPNMSNARAEMYAEQFIDCVGDKGFITFAEFTAFQKFINHLPAIERVLRATFRRFPEANINANTFRALVRSHAINTFTPLENTICFHLFGSEDKSLITLTSFKDNIISTPMTHQIFKLDDGTIDMDEQMASAAPNRFGGDDLRRLISARDLGRNLVIGAVASGLGVAMVFPLDAV
ncbi:hypothetical protein SARC_12903, partial [Sphaeroforma arctica JP610]